MIHIISKSKNKQGQRTAQITIVNNGKSQTKHVVANNPNKELFFDAHRIPFKL